MYSEEYFERGLSMKIAILGAGRIAGIVSATLAKLDEIDRYAVAARDLGRAEEFAKTYGYRKAYGSYEEMLADPEVSVNRFFNRPDREKQFLYRLLMQEENPERALENFRACLARINTPETYVAFLHSGFHVILRDDKRSIDETVALAESLLGLDK